MKQIQIIISVAIFDQTSEMYDNMFRIRSILLITLEHYHMNSIIVYHQKIYATLTNMHILRLLLVLTHKIEQSRSVYRRNSHECLPWNLIPVFSWWYSVSVSLHFCIDWYKKPNVIVLLYVSYRDIAIGRARNEKRRKKKWDQRARPIDGRWSRIVCIIWQFIISISMELEFIHILLLLL